MVVVVACSMVGGGNARLRIHTANPWPLTFLALSASHWQRLPLLCSTGPRLSVKRSTELLRKLAPGSRRYVACIPGRPRGGAGSPTSPLTLAGKSVVKSATRAMRFFSGEKCIERGRAEYYTDYVTSVNADTSYHTTYAALPLYLRLSPARFVPGRPCRGGWHLSDQFLSRDRNPYSAL